MAFKPTNQDKRTFLQFFDYPGMFGERLFEMFDTKKNGLCDKEEFVTGMAWYIKGSPQQKIKLLFDLYDLKGSHVCFVHAACPQNININANWHRR